MIDYAGLQNGLIILGGILSMGYMTYRYFTQSRREVNKDTNEETQNNAGISNNTNEQTQNTEGVVNTPMNTTDSIEVLQEKLQVLETKLELFNEMINKTLITDVIKALKMNSIYLTKLKKITKEKSVELPENLETNLNLILGTDDNMINHLHSVLDLFT